MSALIVLFNLQEGVDPAKYEAWAQTVDVPTVEGLDSVDSMKVYRVDGLMGSDEPAPYRYCEVIEVNDLEGLGRDVTTEEMQAIATKFQGEYAVDLRFLVSEQFA
jgi:hypothetical protein